MQTWRTDSQPDQTRAPEAVKQQNTAYCVNLVPTRGYIKTVIRDKTEIVSAAFSISVKL